MTSIIKLKHALTVAEDEYSAACAKLEAAQHAYSIETHQQLCHAPYARPGLESTDADCLTDC